MIVIFLSQFSSGVLTKKCPFIKGLTCKPVIQPGTCPAYRQRIILIIYFGIAPGSEGERPADVCCRGKKVKGIDSGFVPCVIFLTSFFFFPAGRYVPKFPET
jgi:hypothetical protein